MKTENWDIAMYMIAGVAAAGILRSIFVIGLVALDDGT